MTSIQAIGGSIGLIFVLSVPSLAHAGCTKDTDCKGERICEQEQCVAPSAGAATPSQNSGIPAVDLRFARERRGIAHRNLHGTWVLFGFQAAAAVSFIGWLPPFVGDPGDDGSIGSYSSLLAVTLFGGVTGPIASIGGAQARQGLERLGLEPVETGLRKPGLGLYGVSMGFVGGTAGALVATLASNRDCYQDGVFTDSPEFNECVQAVDTQRQVFAGVYAGLGVTAAITGLISTVLLQTDTNRQRRALLDAIDDAEAGRLSRVAPRVRLVGVAPWFDARADRTDAGVAVSGSF